MRSYEFMTYKYKFVTDVERLDYDGTIEDFLNSYGEMGWELSAINFGGYIFRKNDGVFNTRTQSKD